ncbi:MAG TPA: response regulator [Candidatus Saccharimonadales bacterium]|nr:response regulator [Candidatus Saccharimonadales bacterium]
MSEPAAGAPAADAILDQAIQGWAGRLAGPLAAPVELTPGEWQSVPASDWLALGQDWALGAVQLSWGGHSGTALVGVPRARLARLAGPAEGAAEEASPASAQKLLEDLVESAATVLGGLRCAAGGSPACSPTWCRVQWDFQGLQQSDAEALAQELHANACLLKIEGRDFETQVNLGLPAEFAADLAPAPAEAAPAAAAPPSAAPAGPAPVVAVMAFDARLRHELREAAQPLGSEVEEFADLRDYLQSPAARRTRLILLGVSLDNRTALEHCRAIRQDPALRQVPVLMCAPEATRDLLLQALKAGAHGFAVAPFPTSIPGQLKRLLKAA